MFHDFLPAIVSVGILVGVFLFAWMSDVRRMRNLKTLELTPTELPPSMEDDSVEPLSMASDAG